jgi:hypothetical protein
VSRRQTIKGGITRVVLLEYRRKPTKQVFAGWSFGAGLRQSLGSSYINLLEIECYARKVVRHLALDRLSQPAMGPLLPVAFPESTSVGNYLG